MATAPQLINIDLLDDHQLNPRPIITEEDVSDLVRMMGDTYSASHAIRVRQIGERYQIIGGHRRTAAAKIKGHKEIWCFVEVMGRDKAFFELVRDNQQKELDPIYVGIHAHLACDVAEDGKGMKGGVAEYARQIGRDRGAVSRLRAAGEVAKKACHVTRFPDGISRQLYEISRLPEPCWKESCDWLLNLTESQRRDHRMGTVRDVNSRVSAAMSLELSAETRGTGQEMTARMAVFMGRPLQRENHKKPNENKVAQKELPTESPKKTIAEIASEEDTTTSHKTAAIKQALISRPKGVAVSHDSQAAFCNEGPTAASCELQEGSKASVTDQRAISDACDSRIGPTEALEYLGSSPDAVLVLNLAVNDLTKAERARLITMAICSMDDSEIENIKGIVDDAILSRRQECFSLEDDATKDLINARSDIEEAVTVSMQDDGVTRVDWCEYASDETRSSVITAFADSLSPGELGRFNSCADCPTSG